MKNIQAEIWEKQNFQDLVGNIIAEERAEYGRKENYFTPFFEREDLLPREKTSIGNYQDVWDWNEQRKEWSFEIPKDWEKKSWCYTINTYCRNPDFKNSILKEERELIEFNIENINNAIQKSVTNEEYTIFRGVKNIDWLSHPHEEEEYTEKAFGSYSLLPECALRYTNSENPILFKLNLKNGTQALYFDNAEEEILLPRNTTYIIEKISEELLLVSSTLNRMTYKEVTTYSVKIKKISGGRISA
ncbi:MAG: ADP-ribosyltransferase [Methanosarcinales archaeon]|jgi:hypothetical protein|nr:ADP-ribosyltransferase [Methanosarcinales archaeon]